MPEIESISWQSITGNKFRKDLRPEMFSEKGCTLQQKVRPIGVGVTFKEAVVHKEDINRELGAINKKLTAIDMNVSEIYEVTV